MALNNSQIVLTATTIALTIVSAFLFKFYLSEKKEKLKKIDQNIQVIAEKNQALEEGERLRDANARISAERQEALNEGERLRDANARIFAERQEALNEGERLRGANARISAERQEALNEGERLRNENQVLVRNNQELADANFGFGDNLTHLHQINDQIETLQNQANFQVNRNIRDEVLAEHIDTEDRKLTREQDLEYERLQQIARLNTEIQNLHDEFLRIRLPQIKYKVQVREYERQIRLERESMAIIDVFIQGLAARGGDAIRRIRNEIDFRRLPSRYGAINEDLDDDLQEIKNRIDQEIANRQVRPLKRGF